MGSQKPKEEKGLITLSNFKWSLDFKKYKDLSLLIKFSDKKILGTSNSIYPKIN